MRRKGEGTITKRKDGRYEVAVSLGYGARKRAYARTEREALAKLAELTGHQRKGLPFPDEQLTVGSYLVQHWLEAMRPPRARPKTWTTYESYVRCQLVPRLGRFKLARLTPAHVEAALAAALRDGLSPRAAQAMRNILRSALSRAERDGLVHRNVAALADPPRMTPREVAPFTPEQAATLVQGMQGRRLEPLWLLLLGTGMRHGEALALTWDDVDFEAGVVHVRRSLERWEGQWRLMELTKTLRSRRDLPLSSPVAAALTAQRDRQRWEAAKAGSEWRNAFNLVFTTETGGPLHESTVQHAFDRLLRELGLPKHRVYDLRHSAATFLLAAGADLRSVMEQLGHSQIHLTANVYGHILAERKREMAAVMGRLLEGMAATREAR